MKERKEAVGDDVAPLESKPVVSDGMMAIGFKTQAVVDGLVPPASR